MTDLSYASPSSLRGSSYECEQWTSSQSIQSNVLVVGLRMVYDCDESLSLSVLGLGLVLTDGFICGIGIVSGRNSSLCVINEQHPPIPYIKTLELL